MAESRWNVFLSNGARDDRSGDHRVGVRTAPTTVPIHHGTPKNALTISPLMSYVLGMTTRRTVAIAFPCLNAYLFGRRIATPMAARSSVNREACSNRTIGSPNAATRSSPSPAGPMRTP